MKKILFCVLMLVSAGAAAREYDVVCKWSDGTKDVYPQREVWTANINQGGTIIQLRSGDFVQYSNAVQCKMVTTKE